MQVQEFMYSIVVSHFKDNEIVIMVSKAFII